MTINPHARAVARRLLEAATTELECRARDGRYDTICIKEVGDASRLLEEEGLAQRALILLQTAPDEAFWRGAVTNFNLPSAALVPARSIASNDDLAGAFPGYGEQSVLATIEAVARSEPGVALCVEGRYDEARSLAASDRALEEIGATLAVLGQFDAATDVAHLQALPECRRRGIEQVLAIELFRRGQCDRADRLVKELETGGLGPWDGLQLALGLAGREPWAGYPYPDW